MLFEHSLPRTLERYRIRRLVAIICALVMFAGCKPSPKPAMAPSANLSPEPWSKQAPQQWPQIVLTNDAEFRGHTPLQGASCFLVDTRSGVTWAATALHLIGENGGVQPEIKIQELNEKISTWRMFPRTLPDNYLEADKVAVAGLGEGGDDWLLLTIKPSDRPLPATAVKIRPEAVRVGEKVFLIGCPYAEEGCKQNVYAGTVVERGNVAFFRYELETAVDIRGFSGAPIVDKNGHLVGVMTVWFTPRMKGDQFLEAGGQDAAYIVNYTQR